MSGPDEPAAEALVDRRQHDRLHRRADVDPPVRDRPVDLGAVVVELVRLLVAAVVDRLADARDELGGALADPRPEVGLGTIRPRRRSGRPRRRRVGGSRHDDQALALAERRPTACAGRGRAIRSMTSRLDAALLEPADGPALHARRRRNSIAASCATVAIRVRGAFR